MWENIIGQESVINTLKNIYKSNKISHSYIFYGPEGSGKDAVAIEFAKLINCENVNNNFEHCDFCKSCKQISQLYSTEFKFITALPSGVKDSVDDEDPAVNLSKTDFDLYTDALREKSKNPYFKINLPKANNIRIDSIRYIKREIYLTGAKGKRKIFLISNADNMNQQASNSLLKILEDPPGNSIMILTTSRLNSLIPTIIGRCQKIKFNPISSDLIKKYLLKINNNLTPVEANVYASLSEGNINKCLEISEQDFLELRVLVINMLRSIVSDKKIKAGNEIAQITGQKDKNRVKQSLQILLFWFRDSIYQKAGLENLIINTDEIESLSRFNKNCKFDVYKIIKVIEDTLSSLEYNLNLELLMYNLMMILKKEIKRV